MAHIRDMFTDQKDHHLNTCSISDVPNCNVIFATYKIPGVFF